VGATVLGNRGQIARLQIAARVERKMRGRLVEPIYSKSSGSASTEYKCASCGVAYIVGPGEQTPTIESLKLAGCPNCGGGKFRRAGRRRPD
jgi:DNA-directed RNA polymerase subunit RPC12/RpoP